ncbi:ribonuclease H-like domain-containing protein [Tanacetum coccineum]
MVRTINNLIPPTFWVEALNMAVHLLNILPFTVVANEIPYTPLFDKNLDYSLLRTFECLCYPHLYPTHKLEPHATPSILLGHASNHLGYRCLDLKTNKIIISRHDTFDETVFPYGSIQPNPASRYTFLDDSPDIIPQTIPVIPPKTEPTHNIPLDNILEPNTTSTATTIPDMAHYDQAQPQTALPSLSVAQQHDATNNHLDPAQNHTTAT